MQVKSFFQMQKAEDEIRSGETVRVVIKQGDTLIQIMKKMLGKYDQESLNRVLSENPGIEDADRIYADQVIYISKK